MKHKFVLLAFLSFLLSASIAVAERNYSTIAPQVIETDPFVGEELRLDQSITIYFDQAMNRASVEAALTVADETDPVLDWVDDLALTVAPQTAWARNAEIKITISSGATNQAGIPLESNFEATFKTIGYLEVSDALPTKGQTQVPEDSVILVTFNRPVVPLTVDAKALPQPLIIEPPLSGTGEWMNTSVYIFRPDKPLRGGISYTVTIPKDLSDVTGTTLREDFTWTFSTPLPAVTGVTPFSDFDRFPLDGAIEVSFSQPMDTASIETAFRLSNAETDQDVAGTFLWKGDRRSFRFVPYNLLKISSQYHIQINNLTAINLDGANLEVPIDSYFFTVTYPAIVRTDPENNAITDPNYGAFAIYFSAPIDEKTVPDKIRIEPEPFQEFEGYIDSNGMIYYVYFDSTPSTTYTITVLPGIADPYGNTIDEELKVTYSTSAYTPEIELNRPGYVGVYSAYAPRTRIFATHRNVSRLDVYMYAIDLPTLAAFTGSAAYDFRQQWSPIAGDLVRSWSVDVRSPQNVRRYELLMLSKEGEGGIQNVQCLGAPAPRLAIGQLVTLAYADDVEDPAPLNLRNDPNLLGSVITSLKPDAQLEIIGGPICNDSYIWWQTQIPDTDTVGWTVEGTFETQFLKPVDESIELPPLQRQVDLALPGLPPGVYFIQMLAPETDALNFDPIEHVAVVASANITLKKSAGQALAWVTDMESGEPLPDVPVMFYDAYYEMLGTATTDQDGVATLKSERIHRWDELIYAVVQTDDAFAFVSSQWTSGIDTWNFHDTDGNVSNDVEVYLYTDRPLYRPDQMVYFRGVIRHQEDIQFMIPPDLETVWVRIVNWRNEVVHEEDYPLTDFGTFSGEFKLDAEASLGTYRIEVDLEPETTDNVTQNLYFDVAEYVAPEFQTSLTPTQPQVMQGDTIEVTVESRYFFGGGVSNAKVSWTLLTANYFFPYTGAGHYSFADVDEDSRALEYYPGGGERISDGEGTTDDQGRFVIEIPADLSERTQSQVFTIEARVSDESGREVAGRAKVVVHQGEVYIGLKPEKYVTMAGQEAAFNLVSVNWDSEPVPNQTFDFRIVERRWYSVMEEDELGRAVWTWDLQEIPLELDENQITTDEDGKAQIHFVPHTGGVYKIYATSHDGDGNEIRSSAIVWVGGDSYVAWRPQNNSRFSLITDADEYHVGDTAEILITSPFQGETTALVTVERAGVFQHEVVHLSNNSTIYKLPITEDYAPDVYVTVMLVKGVDAFNSFSAFRMGVARLNVNTEQFILNIDVESSIEEGEFAGPGDEVTYTLKTTDWKGNPVRAELGLGVTDLAVLTLANPNSVPLLDFFYSKRGLTVNTSTPLTISVDRVTQEIIERVKGGGGKGGGGGEGLFTIRENFVDTPGWEPALVTDENGEASFTVTLPDNLTTWHLDVRGVTNGDEGSMLVGEASYDVLSTKPLLIRPVTPRFMVAGDEVTLAAIVNNNTSEDQAIEVSMQGTGFTVSDATPLSQSVTVEKGSRVRVEWNVEILAVEGVDLTFFVKSEDGAFTDATKPTLGQGDDQVLPVYRYEVPEVAATANALLGSEASSKTEAVLLPRQYEVTEGELVIKVDRSLASAALDSLDYLENFPYQCIEQTVSRFLPNVVTMRALTRLGVEDAELQTVLDAQVNFGLQRLYAQQHYDGGWGWFPQDYSNPLTTAYALLSLAEARRNGYPIDGALMVKAAEFLQGEINKFDALNPTTWWANRQAFLIYAMTFSGFYQTSPASVLYDHRKMLNLDAKAFLAMSLYRMNSADPRAAEFLTDFVNGAVLDATGVYWEDSHDYWNWTTNTRTTALILKAFVQIDPTQALIPDIVRWLMTARAGDAWETTQETAWSIMALTDWMVQTGELQPDYTFQVMFNDQAQTLRDNSATPANVKDSETLRISVKDFLTDEANRLTFVHSEGQGNLYYTAQLKAYLPVPEIEAANRGVIIERRYYQQNADEEHEEPITSGKVGDHVDVVLTIIVPNDLDYVFIEDPLPAGAEAIDMNLNTSSIVGQAPGFTRDPLSYGWGWWWFSHMEFRDEKAVLYATHLPKGTYEFRYSLYLGLPGTYNVIPPTAQEFYFPEVYGRGAGSTFTIEAADQTE